MPEGTIFIVEDRPELAAVLEYQLQVQGYATLFAEDGPSLCRCCCRRRVFLGLHYPSLLKKARLRLSAK